MAQGKILVTFIERNNYKNNYLDNYIHALFDPLTIYQANIGQISLLVSMPCTRRHFTRSKRDATQLEHHPIISQTVYSAVIHTGGVLL